MVVVVATRGCEREKERLPVKHLLSFFAQLLLPLLLLLLQPLQAGDVAEPPPIYESILLYDNYALSLSLSLLGLPACISAWGAELLPSSGLVGWLVGAVMAAHK